MKEFDIIEHFFNRKVSQRKDVEVGIGDDCAITNIPIGQSLAVTTDTLVSGVHFPANTPPEAIAHKSLAVSLSDLAAVGAEPAWYSLAITLPKFDKNWLERFSDSLFKLSEYYSIQLIGGDTTQGPMSITVTAHGFVPHGQALTRSGAKPGDLIYVTGTIGDAGVGLDIVQNKLTTSQHCSDFLINRLNYPSPRMLAGTALRRVASSCVDISDGLANDLQHLLNASKCGAKIQVDQLPLSIAMQEAVNAEQAYNYALSSGDDYELLFTVSEERKATLDIALANSNVIATCIGHLTGIKGKLELRFENERFIVSKPGYEHFSS